MAVPVKETRDAYAFEQITVGTTAVGLTVGNIRSGTDSTKEVELTVETAQIRYRTDGTAPTASVGNLVNPTERIALHSYAELINFSAIRVGATSATLDVIYRR